MSSYKDIAIDIETTGLNPWKDEILMVGLYDGKTYTCCRTKEAFIHALSSYSLSGDIVDFVGHNVAFDIKFLIVKGWWKPDGRIIHDTKILAHLVKDKVPKAFLERYAELRKELNKTLPKGQTHREVGQLSLKVIAPWYLKVPMFWETPGNYDNEEYNKKDCIYTYQLFQLLLPRVQEEGALGFYESRMLNWSRMIMEMEIKGIAISNAELSSVEHEYLAKRDRLKTELDQQWTEANAAYHNLQIRNLRAKYEEMAEAQLAKGKDVEKTKQKYLGMYFKALPKIETAINYSSPTQMSWLLKDCLGLDITGLDGDETTGKAVLQRLAVDREDIKNYLAWREADKVLTMYIPTYRELQIDSVIHPSFNLTGTRTGRTSSSGPNLQQVPAKLYRLFKPRPGCKFIQYDLSGIEAALIALYSGDKTLFDILEKGESIHDHNAKAMFNLDCPVTEVSILFPKQRKVVKNIGFACFYGAGWRRISQVFAAGGFPITDKEAKEKLALLKSYYPGAFEFHREITEVFEQGETVFNLLGRPINIQPDENAYMQGFNTLIQSSASDLNLYACEKFWKATEHLGTKPLLLVHDFILAEVTDYWAKVANDELVKAMTNFKLESIHGPIKLSVEGGIADGWEK